MTLHNSRKRAVVAALDLIDTYDIGQGEVIFKFDDGNVIRSRFCYVSDNEWQEIERKARKGIIGYLSEWLQKKRYNAEGKRP